MSTRHIELAGCYILDAGQFRDDLIPASIQDEYVMVGDTGPAICGMEDLIPICRPEGNVFIGDTGFG